MLSLTIDQKEKIKSAIKKMRERGGKTASKSALDALSLLQNCQVDLTLLNLDVSSRQDELPVVDIYVSDGEFEFRFISYATMNWGLSEHKRVSVWTTTKRALSSKWVTKEEFTLNTDRYLLDNTKSSHKPSSKERIRAYLCRKNINDCDQ